MSRSGNALAGMAAGAGKFTELRQRLMFVLGALIVYRIGCHIPVPGVNPVAMTAFMQQQEGIVNMLNLLRPIYQKTAAYGHFGRDEPEFSWEATDRAALLRGDAGL